MDIKIVFNAQLRDRLGCKDQSLSLDDTAKLADLWPLLREGDAAGIFDSEGKNGALGDGLSQWLAGATRGKP